MKDDGTTDRPRVSVAMSVHDGERYLAQAVESILGQSFGDFEFLVVDDGSTDHSREILERYRQRDRRIRILPPRPQLGLIASLNELLAEARGEYLARMDADDIALPERFRLQVQHLDAHPECIAVGSRVLLVDPDGEPLRPFSQERSHEEIDAAHMMGRGGAICHPAVMMRTESLRRAGGYDPTRRHAEDLDLFLRLAELGRLENLPDSLLLYRMHAGSIGQRNRDEQRRSATEAVRAAHCRRGLDAPRELGPGTLNATATEADTLRRWAWWALTAGNVATARKHAWAALRRDPWRRSSWKVFTCALRGW